MEGNSIKTFENLCRIFKMRIKLDKENNKDVDGEVISNYEKYLKKIDTIHNKEFETEIRKLIAPEKTIEEEQKRLRKLINILEERITKRDAISEEFYNVTGSYITGLQMIISEAEFKDKKDRLDIITRYIDTRNEKESINDSISTLTKSLSEEEKKKEEYVSKNKIMEDELYSVFTGIVKDEEYYRNIDEESINKELDIVLDKVRETKETLDITKESVNSLKVNGLEEDYTTYIEDAEKSYYIWKNKELTLSIYNLVINFKEELIDMTKKRNEINSLLLERQELKNTLNIDENDNLLDFERLVLEQIKTLEIEKEIIDNISNYTSRINFKEDRLSELEEVNNSVEILAILREYGLIDTYEVDEETGDSDETDYGEMLIKEVYDPYRIIEVKDYPKTLNIGLAKLKGESIREKVNKKLNPEIKEEIISEEEKDTSIEINTNSEIIPELNNNIEEPITPVWEIPVITEMFENNTPQTIENLDIPNHAQELNKEEPLQVPDFTNVNTIPSITPVMEPVINNNPMKEEFNNNLFWTPVSEDKLDTDKFPSINIPVQNNFTDVVDNFGFPDINN